MTESRSFESFEFSVCHDPVALSEIAQRPPWTASTSVTPSPVKSPKRRLAASTSSARAASRVRSAREVPLAVGRAPESVGGRRCRARFCGPELPEDDLVERNAERAERAPGRGAAGDLPVAAVLGEDVASQVVVEVPEPDLVELLVGKVEIRPVRVAAARVPPRHPGGEEQIVDAGAVEVADAVVAEWVVPGPIREQPLPDADVLPPLVSAMPPDLVNVSLTTTGFANTFRLLSPPCGVPRIVDDFRFRVLERIGLVDDVSPGPAAVPGGVVEEPATPQLLVPWTSNSWVWNPSLW